MTRTIDERFYGLLPQVYRQRDALQGQPLRALLAVLEGEYQALREDLEATYDNWFVDTCDQWVLPYLADLLGIRGLDHSQHLFPTQRRLVANALGYRRRKGTIAVLEHALRDVTGWDVRVVEYFRLVAVTQHLATPGPGAGRTVDLRQSLALSQIGSAFDAVAHTWEVRGSGADLMPLDLDAALLPPVYNPANLGVFVWKTRAYPLDNVFACPLPSSDRSGCFTFDVAGRSVPLVNLPIPVTAIGDRAEAQNLPLRLTRQLLAHDLQSHAAQEAFDDNAGLSTCRPAVNAAAQAGNTTFYGPDRSFAITYRLDPHEPFEPVTPDQVVVADLSRWEAPPIDRADTSSGAKVVAVDPELGRMVFLGPQVPRQVGDVLVSATFGFTADTGGGPYSRYDALQSLENLPDQALRVTVAGGGLSALPSAAPDDGAHLPGSPGWTRPLQTLSAAVATWNRYCIDCEAQGERPIGVIAILDTGRYTCGPPPGDGNAGEPPAALVIRLPQGAHLSIVAADGMRPFIQLAGAVRIVTSTQRAASKGPKAPEAGDGAEVAPIDRRLELNGLYIDGLSVDIHGQKMEGFVDLEIRHCTILNPGLQIEPSCPHTPQLRIQIGNCLLGPVQLPSAVFELAMSDSVVDQHGQPVAIGGDTFGGAGPPAVLERVTVLGAMHVQELRLASDVIFAGPLQVEPDNAGLVRRCYLPFTDSLKLRQEHCQPELALRALERPATPVYGVAGAMAEAPSTQLPQSIRPIFTSTDPAHPGYAQLHPSTAIEIRHGGQAGAEMGAFHKLNQHQREANLRRAIEEFSPLGKHVSVHFVT